MFLQCYGCCNDAYHIVTRMDTGLCCNVTVML